MSRFTHKVVDGIKKVLVFMGYPRSGHTILAAMLNAHPNIAVSKPYHLLMNWKDIKMRLNGEKYDLCSEMVLKSLTESSRHEKKGYSLVIPSQWQGNFSQLRVIGDESAGKYARHYNEQ